MTGIMSHLGEEGCDVSLVGGELVRDILLIVSRLLNSALACSSATHSGTSAIA